MLNYVNKCLKVLIELDYIMHIIGISFLEETLNSFTLYAKGSYKGNEEKSIDNYWVDFHNCYFNIYILGL